MCLFLDKQDMIDWLVWSQKFQSESYFQQMLYLEMMQFDADLLMKLLDQIYTISKTVRYGGV